MAHMDGILFLRCVFPLTSLQPEVEYMEFLIAGPFSGFPLNWVYRGYIGFIQGLGV